MIDRIHLTRIFAALLLACGALFGASPATAQVQRSLYNTSFETPSIASGCQGYVYAARVTWWQTTDAPLTSPTADFDSPNGCVGSNGTNPPGGTRVFEYYSTNVTDNQTNLVLRAAQGSNFVELNAQTASRLYQNICLIPGETVGYAFYHMGRMHATNTDVARMRLGGSSMLGTGTSVMTATDSNDGTPGSAANGLSTNATRTTGPLFSNTGGTNRFWGSYSGTFVVPAANGGIQQIAFEAVSTAGGNIARGNFMDDIRITLRPVIEMASAAYSSVESNGSAPQIQFRVAGVVPTGGMSVSLSVSSATATIGTDYTVNGGSNPNFTFTIPAGDYGTGTLITAGIPVALVNDTAVEAAENFVVAINNSTPYAISSTTTCNTSGAAQATYTITDNDGTVRVIKDAQPNHAQDFAFTTTGTGLSAFSLDDDSDATLPNSRDFFLNAGAYGVTETATPGWVLNAINCTDPDNGTTVTLASGLASIDLDIGETVICTYVNIIIAPLSLAKSSVVSSDGRGVVAPNAKAIPGATVRYCILVTNPGPAAATTLAASDPLPANVTYAPGSLRSGTSCASASTVEDDNATGTDESDPFGMSFASNTVSGVAANLASGGTFAMTFEVTIN